MPTAYPGQRIRVEVDIFDRTWRFIDVLTGQKPVAWRGGKGQFEIAFFSAHGSDATADSMVDLKAAGGLSAITVALRGPFDNTAGGRLSPIVFSKTVLVSAMNGLTIDDWNGNDPTKAHIVIPFTDSEISLDVPGEDTDYWMVISAMSNDADPEEVPLAATVLTLLEDGVTDGNGPRQMIVVPSDTDGGDSYQMLARWENDANELYPGPKVTSGGPYRSVIVQNETDNLWYRVLNTVVNNVPSFEVDPTPLQGIDSFPMILVRNVNDWSYYQLKLRTENNTPELYLSEEPVC